MLFMYITGHYFTPQQSWPWYILMGNMANPDILYTLHTTLRSLTQSS
jgi:hypothetical protein